MLMPRPRDESIDSSVLASTLDLIIEIGYRNLTWEAVARMAGTTKPALRRRWASLPALVLDALSFRDEISLEADSGCIVCDLISQVQALQRDMADPRFGRVVPALIMDLRDNMALQQAFIDVIWRPRRDPCVRNMRRAQERGELRMDIDPETVVDLLSSPVITRSMLGLNFATPEFAFELVDTVLTGVRANSIMQYGCRDHRDHCHE